MHYLHSKNLADLWHQLCKVMEDEPEVTMGDDGKPHSKSGGGYFLHPYDYWMESDSSEVPKLALEEIGYMKQKARHLLGRYLEPEQVRSWVKFIEQVCKDSPAVKGEIYLQTKVQPKAKGGCLAGFMYRHRGMDGPEPTLIVISRSIEMPGKAMADVMLISALCRLISETLGVPDLKIQWYTPSIVMPSKRAYLYIIYKWPKKVKFACKLFDDYLKKGWNKYYLTDFQFSFATNVRTKKFFIRKQEGKVTHEVTADKFYQVLKEYIS